MTKHEFMTRLTNELHKRNVADAADIAEECEQHFAFKLADGYSEEEIAAKLGAPEELAAQFGDVPQADTGHSVALTWLWLGWVDLFFGVFAALLLALGVVLAYQLCKRPETQRRRAVLVLCAVLLGGNVLRYGVVYPFVLGVVKLPVEFSTAAYFVVPTILLASRRKLHSWAAYSGLMAGFFRRIHRQYRRFSVVPA